MAFRSRPLAKAEKMERAAALYLQGYTHAAIGREMGIAADTASKYIAEVRKSWLESSVRDFDTAKARELAKIDLLETTYWRAWEDSRRDKEVVQVEDSTKGGAKGYIRAEGQSGNPAFLDGVMKCIEKRCKILGLDAPTKNINITIPWDKLTDEQVDRIIAGEDPKKVLPPHLLIDVTPKEGQDREW